MIFLPVLITAVHYYFSYIMHGCEWFPFGYPCAKAMSWLQDLMGFTSSTPTCLGLTLSPCDRRREGRASSSRQDKLVCLVLFRIVNALEYALE